MRHTSPINATHVIIMDHRVTHHQSMRHTSPINATHITNQCDTRHHNGSSCHTSPINATHITNQCDTYHQSMRHTSPINATHITNQCDTRHNVVRCHKSVQMFIRIQVFAYIFRDDIFSICYWINIPFEPIVPLNIQRLTDKA